MRSVVLEEFGRPVAVRETEPAAEGRLVVAVEYGGVCGTDVHLQAGRLPIQVPIVLGHEGVGRVSSVAPGLELDALGQRLNPGDRVAWASSIACGTCFYCREVQEPTLCERRRVYGITQAGSWSDTVALEPGTAVVRLTEQQPSEAVIALGCAGPTVVHGLLHVAPVRTGESVVVQGAGPVGLAAAMYAQLAGARAVIVIGAPAGRLALAAELGVGDEIVDIDEVDVDARLQRVRELTGGRGADLVIECAGVPAAVAEALDLVRPAGRVLVLGQYTDHGPTPINPHFVTRKQLTVLGSWAFSAAHYLQYVRTVPQLRERFALEKLITPFPLERAQDALAAARAGEVGKAVLVP